MKSILYHSSKAQRWLYPVLYNVLAGVYTTVLALKFYISYKVFVRGKFWINGNLLVVYKDSKV